MRKTFILLHWRVMYGMTLLCHYFRAVSEAKRFSLTSITHWPNRRGAFERDSHRPRVWDTIRIIFSLSSIPSHRSRPLFMKNNDEECQLSRNWFPLWAIPFCTIFRARLLAGAFIAYYFCLCCSIIRTDSKSAIIVAIIAGNPTSPTRLLDLLANTKCTKIGKHR